MFNTGAVYYYGKNKDIYSDAAGFCGNGVNVVANATKKQ